MKNIFLFLTLLSLQFNASAQLPNGSIAPDFTLTDRDGNVHNLYTYLNEGKVVFLKFFACHCPSCWAYHNTHRLDSLYDIYGPQGTNQIMILMLEHDQNNPEAFTGGGTYTQGDWTLNNSVPMIDVEGTTDRQVFDDYNLNYYPMVMKVCSDKTTELMSTSYTVDQLFQEADDCAGTLNLDTEELKQSVYVDGVYNFLKYGGFEEVSNISLYNMMGQRSMEFKSEFNGVVDLSGLNRGMYIAVITDSNGTFKQKIMVR